jgi:hypothetical protein
VINGWLSLPWFLWAVIALAIAAIYYFIWPRKAVTSNTGFRYLIIRWGHTLTWILLAINFILRGIDPTLNGAANWVALAGGMVYVLFVAMTPVVK